MQYVYTGPSWAKTSFPMTTMNTNLAKEWKISFHDLSCVATSVLNRVNAIKHSQYKLPIIWIYNEPLADLQHITGMTMTEFVARPDWQDVKNECNHYCLSAIAELDLPVLLIGGHSDIVDCNHKNITVGCHSWQKWLAVQANMTVNNDIVFVDMEDGGNFTIDHAWGAEVAHRFIYEHPEVTPTPSLVNNMWNIFYFWQKLEQVNLFYEVHPNLHANQIFAEFLLPSVQKFLKENK